MSRLTFAVCGTIALAAIVVAWRGQQTDHSWLSSTNAVYRTQVPSKQTSEKITTTSPSNSSHPAVSTSKSDLSAFNLATDKAEADVEVPTLLPPTSPPARTEVVTRLPLLTEPSSELDFPRQDLAATRLPPTDEPTPQDDPQIVDGNAQQPANVAEKEEGDIVLFAAEAVRLHLPQDWHLAEVPYGRQLRLVMTPQPLKRHRTMPRDGVWLTYHAQPTTEIDSVSKLTVKMPRHLRLATDNEARSTGQREFRIGQWPAVREDFTVEAPSSAQASPTEASRGFHLLAQTSWGLLELHAIAPTSQWPQRAEQFDQLVAKLTLQQPKQRPQTIMEVVRDATPILGFWKAYRSHFQLYGDGRIVILLDSLKSRSLDAAPEKKNPARRQRLPGRYVARDDLLIVTWDDGSKSNYRWRLENGELLLTDNDGQVSQLRRYFR